MFKDHLTMSWQEVCFTASSRISASRRDDGLNDVEFLFDDITVKANRTILAMASPVMNTQLFGPLSPQFGVPIPVKDGTPRGFRAMLDFIYNEENYAMGDLLDDKEEIAESDDLRKVLELLQFGDKYMIKSLVHFCRNLLLRKIKLNDDNIFAMFSVISEYEEYTTEFRIVQSQIKQYEEFVEIVISKELIKIKRPQQSQFKFKVNQSSMFQCDLQKQLNQNNKNKNQLGCPIKKIVWKPQNCPPEIVDIVQEGEEMKMVNFYAEANAEISVTVQLCSQCGLEWIHMPSLTNVNFKAKGIEVDIIEVNGKLCEDTLVVGESIFFDTFFFRPLSDYAQRFQGTQRGSTGVITGGSTGETTGGSAGGTSGASAGGTRGKGGRGARGGRGKGKK